MMIVGRVDEREWKAECLRLEKKLADIGTSAKDARKKGRYIRICKMQVLVWKCFLIFIKTL